VSNPNLIEKTGVDRNGRNYTRQVNPGRQEQQKLARTPSAKLPQKLPAKTIDIFTLTEAEKTAQGVATVETHSTGGITTTICKDAQGRTHRGGNQPAVQRSDGSAEWVEHEETYMTARLAPGFKYDPATVQSHLTHYLELKAHGYTPQWKPVFHSFTDPVQTNPDIYAVYGRECAPEDLGYLASLPHEEAMSALDLVGARLLPAATVEGRFDDHREELENIAAALTPPKSQWVPQNLSQPQHFDPTTGLDSEGYGHDNYHAVTGLDRDGYNRLKVNSEGRTRAEQQAWIANERKQRDVSRDRVGNPTRKTARPGDYFPPKNPTP
jgi:hypothetical protein